MQGGWREREPVSEKRVDMFAEWLRRRSERDVVVIGHADCFHRLTGHRLTAAVGDDNSEVFGQWLDNCQLYEYTKLAERTPLSR